MRGICGIMNDMIYKAVQVRDVCWVCGENRREAKKSDCIPWKSVIKFLQEVYHTE